MKIDNDGLKRFIGGLWYFRLVCFEVGPDYYYIFRFRINDIELDGDGCLTFDLSDIHPNRLIEGTWVDNPTNGGKRKYLPAHGLDFSVLSPDLLHVKIDMTADGLLFTEKEKAPSDLDLLMKFPSGYETLAFAIREELKISR